jgi:hypothetical protein
MIMNKRLCGLAGAVLGFAIAAFPTFAQAQAPSLTVELNALQPSDRGCRFTFIATNELGGELASVGLELVLFNKAGMVSRITIVDFKDLPEGKTKVRQFDFSSVDCADLGRVLVNDATECKGEGIDPKACIRQLKTQSRSDTVFGV